MLVCCSEYMLLHILHVTFSYVPINTKLDRFYISHLWVCVLFDRLCWHTYFIRGKICVRHWLKSDSPSWSPGSITQIAHCTWALSWRGQGRLMASRNLSTDDVPTRLHLPRRGPFSWFVQKCHLHEWVLWLRTPQAATEISWEQLESKDSIHLYISNIYHCAG